jgi:hypothetical protein
MTRRAAAIASSLALSSAFVTHATSARADEHPRVVLAIDTCAAVESAEVRRIAGVELDSLLEDEGAAPDASATRVHVRCDGALLKLHVDDPVTRKSLDRSVDLGNREKKARARLLALAIAELVSASWTELVANPEPKVEPVGPPPSIAEKRVVRDVVVRKEARGASRLRAAATLRSFVSWSGPLVGGQLAIEHDLPRIFGGSLALDLDHGARATTLGDATTTTLSLTPMVTLHGALGPFALRAGLGPRVGVAWLRGEPARSNVTGFTVSGAWVAAMTRVALSVPIGPLSVELGGEAGYGILPVVGLVNGTREVAIDGLCLGGSMGVLLTL